MAFPSVQQALEALTKQVELTLQVRLQAVATLEAHCPGATHESARLHAGFCCRNAVVTFAT